MTRGATLLSGGGGVDCNAMFMALGSGMTYNIGNKITRCPALLETAGAMADSFEGATCMPIIPHVKLCPKCSLTKPSSDFNRNKQSKDGLQYACKLCQRAGIKAYRANHPEYKSTPAPEYQRQYYQTNRARVLGRMAQDYQANPEKYKARRQRYESTTQGQHVRRAVEARHNARKARNHQVHYAANDIIKRFNEFNNLCAYCGGGGPFHIDHFIPVSFGGPDSLSNIVPACATCNTSKCDKDPYAWFKSQSFYQVKRWRTILKVLGKTQATYNHLPLL
jgi:5-methylcytosine-specific restriction endonuclease McrA